MRITPENLRQTFEHLRHRPEISLDTETTGLEETDRPFAFIIADEQNVYYFDDRILGKAHWDELSLFAQTYEGRVILQNAKFDMRMILAMGAYFERAELIDDRTVARILKNNHMNYSLDSQAKRNGMSKSDEVKAYIKEHDLYEERRGEKCPRYDWVPLEIMERYAEQDARVTFDLWKIYEPQLDVADRKVLANESKLLRVCFDMERTGVLVNESHTREAMAHDQIKAGTYLEEFHLQSGTPFVNSAKCLAPVFQKAGELLSYTEAGNPSFTDEVLEEYTSPIAQTVRNIRHYQKRISTYYEPYLKLKDARGIIHPTMWPDGTTTGRFSYSDPNLQNIPKDEDPGEFSVRGCFQPTPGHVFMSFDYSQMEYRMMLAYANERRLIEAVMGGADVHQATADLVGITRSHAKTLNFAILYGAGAEKISHMLGCSVPEAKRLKTRYFLGLPAVERLIDNVITTGKGRGFVNNWFGRKLRADFDFAYKLPNYLIQGGGADVCKVAMVNLWDNCVVNPGEMVLQIHDQLVFDLHPSRLHICDKIKQTMEEAFPVMNGMKLLVDVSWSDKSLAEADMKKGLTYGSGSSGVQGVEQAQAQIPG